MYESRDHLDLQDTKCSIVFGPGKVGNFLSAVPRCSLDSHRYTAVLLDDVDLGMVNISDVINIMSSHNLDVASPRIQGGFFRFPNNNADERFTMSDGQVGFVVGSIEMFFFVFRRETYSCYQEKR